jgi:hypothetical protein
MKRWLVRLAFASGVWARTSDLRRLFRCLTLGAAVLARRCHARTERVCTLLCFLGSHFLSLHFGSRADDPSPNANLQERVFLYKKEHVANRGSHSRSYLSRSKLMTLWSLTRLKPGTRIPNSAIRGKTGHPEISRARSRLRGDHPIDLPEARFWIVSGLPTIRKSSRGVLNRNSEHVRTRGAYG